MSKVVLISISICVEDSESEKTDIDNQQDYQSFESVLYNQMWQE